MKEQNKQKEVQQTDTKTKDAVSYKKIAIYLAYGIGGICLVLALFVGFLQFNLFPVHPQTSKGIRTYFSENNIVEKFSAREGVFSVVVSFSEINAELMKEALAVEENIFNLEFDIPAQKAMVNYRINGIFLPVLYQMEEVKEKEISYELKPKALGNIGFPVPRSLVSRILKASGTRELKIVQIPADSFQKYGWENLSWQSQEDGLNIQLTLSTEKLDQIITEIKQMQDKQIQFIYENGTENQKRMVRLLKGYPNTLNEFKAVLVDTYFDQNALMKDLLLMMNSDLLKQTFQGYPFLKGRYDEANLLKEKSDLIAAAISNYGKDIIKAVQSWMEVSGGEFYNNGYPFLKKDLKTVTIRDVVAKWDLPISGNIIERIHFGLDMVDKKLAVIYKVEEGNYAVMKESGHEIVDEPTYLARYHRNLPVEGSMTTDVEIWKEITAKLKEILKTEEVFIRNMKDDGESAFVLLSFLEKPQDVQAITFSKIEGKWLPTASNFKDIPDLQSRIESFNLNLYTDIYEDPKLIYIDDNALENIKEELRFAGKLPEDVEPIYYSYKDKYIYVKLSNQEEYILTTYHQYLDKTLAKEDALAIYGDALPKIILLQASPEELSKAEEAKKEPAEEAAQ